MASIPVVSPTGSGSKLPPAGANGGVDPPLINDGNQSPRHTQGGEGGGGGGSSLQDAATMAATMNNNKGMYPYSSSRIDLYHRGFTVTDWYSRSLVIDPWHHRI